jgi:hypothetical protein
MTAADLRQLATTLDLLAEMQDDLLYGRDANGVGSGPVFVPESIGLRSVHSVLTDDPTETLIVAEYDSLMGEFVVEVR